MAKAKKQISAGLTTKSSAAEVNAVQDYLKRFGYLDGPRGERLRSPGVPAR